MIIANYHSIHIKEFQIYKTHLPKTLTQIMVLEFRDEVAFKKKIIAGELEGDALAKGKRIAFLASRTNAWLSLPMLACMVAANHGGFGF